MDSQRRMNLTGPARVRRRVHTVACLLGPWLAMACSDGRPGADEASMRLPRAAEVPARQVTPAPEPLYDADGKLLASDEVVVGLTLPRGLRLHSEAPRRWLYLSEVPTAKLLAYFGPRLITGEVRRGGGSITYVAAVPREARGGVVKLHVRIGANPSRPGQSLVELREVPPVPDQPPDDAEVRARAAQAFRFAD